MLNPKRFCIQVVVVCILHGLDSGGTRTMSQDVTALGAEYLQNAIRDIQIKNLEHLRLRVIGSPRRNFGLGQPAATRRTDLPTPPPPPPPPPPAPKPLRDSHRRVTAGEAYQLQLQEQLAGVPSAPSLSRDELAALYQAAVSAGNTVQLGGGAGPPLHAALHELPDSYPQPSSTGGHNIHATDAENGYYYYYYPIKTFLNSLIQHELHKPEYGNTLPHATHTHQHNVRVEPIKTVMEVPNKSKSLEPLFMAISGFIGMAVMFVFSMVLLPKLTPNKKKKGRTGRGHFHPPTWGSFLTETCPVCDPVALARLLDVTGS